MLRTCLALVSALALLIDTAAAAPRAAQKVWTVDAAGPITQIQQAVTLANDGDVILVRPGSYTAFEIAGKSLTIQGDPSADVTNFVLFGGGYLGPALQVRDLAIDQAVTIRGLDIFNYYFEPVEAVLLANCVGSVLFEDCAMDATTGPGVVVSGCASASFVRCTASSFGPFKPFGSSQFEVNAGIDVLGSNVFAFESALTGSAGKSWSLGNQETSDGGPGVRVRGGALFAQGCNITGGVGGGSSPTGPQVCTTLRDGGPGLLVDESFGPSRVLLIDSEAVGGPGAQPLPSCSETPGQMGPGRIVTAGDVRDVLAEQRAFGITPVVREGQQVVSATVGVPGDLALVLISVGAGYGVELVPLDIAPHIDVGSFLVLSSGVLAGTNVLYSNDTAPELGPGVQSLTVTAQAVYVNSLGALFLSGPSHLTVVDSAF